LEYTDFPKLNIRLSRLGMGCMRFPRIKDSSGNSIIDEPESIRMVQYAIENGVNYFDTAYFYSGSEEVLGKALEAGLRKKAFIATKSPVRIIKRPEDFDTYLIESLKKLKTEYIDFYLLHGLGSNSWEKVKKFKLLDKMDIAKKEGRIKYIGFSFHDNLELFKEIIDSYSWDMSQIQLNFIGEYYQAGLEGLKYAASKNIGMVIMEPLFGGILGENVQPDIIEKWDSSGIKRTPAEWAFKWIANFKESNVILSGVSNMEQLKEDIEIFGKAFPNSMTEKEKQTIDKVKKLYEKMLKVKCTGCSYCLPCPSGVSIPGIFTFYNRAFLGNSVSSKLGYKTWFCNSKEDASQCNECGQCEKACPQNINIINNLKIAHEYLTS
jgi:uncharacterized protein